MNKYSVKGLPWQTFLKDVSDCKTSAEVAEKAGIDFGVDKCPLIAEMPLKITDNIKGDDGFIHNAKMYRPCPSAYATYRTDINHPLGIVKDKYEIVQNRDAFKFFDDAIGPDKAIWQTAGVLGYGERIVVTAKLPDDFIVKGDPCQSYLIFSNSHDGSCGVNILFAPIRVICQNTLNAAIKQNDCYIRFRHTANVHSKILTAAEILASAHQQQLTTAEMFNMMANTNWNDAMVERYIAKTILTETEMANLDAVDEKKGVDRLFKREALIVEDAGISTRKLNVISTIHDYYFNGIGQREIIGTAWGAYNAITGYFSNVSNKEGEQHFDSLINGSANRTISKALALAAA